jgi:hypothetical protein
MEHPTRAGAKPRSLCYLTASYAADIERFALLRRSITLFSPGIPHHVFVDTEDVALFRQRFGSEPGVTIHASAEVLSPRTERLRRFWRRFRKPLQDYVGWRILLDVTFSGWKVQQIIKLAAAARVAEDAIVFLDSDDFLCHPVAVEDYFAGDDLLLLETPAENYEDFVFEAYRQILVGGAFREKATCFTYIHTPPRFLRRTCARALAHLQTTHRNWERAIIDVSMPSEYNILGWTLRTLEQYHGYRHRPGPKEDWAYMVKDLHLLDAELDTCRAERGRRGFFLIQSNMKDSSYIPRARALIEELARQQ